MVFKQRFKYYKNEKINFTKVILKRMVVLSEYAFIVVLWQVVQKLCAEKK